MYFLDNVSKKCRRRE